MSRTKKLIIALLIVASLAALLGVSMQRAARASRITPATVPWVADPLRAANDALDDGRYPEALAYYMQVPEGDPSYSRAQRFIGWKLYGDELNRPMAGLSYVHRALLRKPFSGNSWEDAARVYGSAIGGLFGREP